MKKLEQKINQKLEQSTNFLNNKSEYVFVKAATPIVNGLAEMEPLSFKTNFPLICVGIMFFSLALFINFYL